MSNLQLPAHSAWGIEHFKQMPRTKAFGRVFSFLIIVLAVASLPLFFFCSEFALTVLARADFFIAILFLKLEGACVKTWFINRFSWPSNNKAFFLGIGFVIIPTIAAASFHWLLFGQFPQIKEVPFSGYVFGCFLVNITHVTFEDVSWRGFLLPRALCLFPGMITLVVLGFLWGWWHMPFHLYLNLMGPEHIIPRIPFFICIFLAFSIVWSISEGSLFPLIFTHALYNTVGFFTSDNILFVEGCSDVWFFTQVKTLSLAFLVGFSLLFLPSRNKLLGSPHQKGL